MRRILVPIDFTPRSDLGYEHALGLARATGGEVTLLNVVPAPGSFALAADAYLGRPMPHASSVKLADARERLDALIASRAHNGVVVHARVEPGSDAAATIARIAVEDHADCIVIATRGRTGAAAALLGSVAQSLLAVATCPLLLVRAARASA